MSCNCNPYEKYRGFFTPIKKSVSPKGKVDLEKVMEKELKKGRKKK